MDTVIVCMDVLGCLRNTHTITIDVLINTNVLIDVKLIQCAHQHH